MTRKSWRSSGVMIIFSLLVSLLAVACTELFDPEIGKQEKVLVVEGLLTDQEGPHEIRLSWGVPYGERLTDQPETGAIVYVEDQTGVRHYFPESQPGVYGSRPEFFARPDFIYVLHIETSEGDQIQSDPQQLNPQPFIDNMDVMLIKRMLEYQNLQGEQEFGEVEGLQFSTLIGSSGQSVPTLRFETSIMVQYVLYELYPERPGDPNYMYCRRKLPVQENVNVVIPEVDVSVGDVLSHEVGFMPRTLRFFEGDDFWGYLRTDRRLLIVRQYALNQEAYIFYKGLHEQLGSEGRMFDPIPGQVTGNLQYINHPGKYVLGFFEVSSMQTDTYAITPEPYVAGRVGISPTHNMDIFPDHECYFEEMPPLWLH